VRRIAEEHADAEGASGAAGAERGKIAGGRARLNAKLRERYGRDLTSLDGRSPPGGWERARAAAAVRRCFEEIGAARDGWSRLNRAGGELVTAAVNALARMTHVDGNAVRRHLVERPPALELDGRPEGEAGRAGPAARGGELRPPAAPEAVGTHGGGDARGTSGVAERLRSQLWENAELAVAGLREADGVLEQMAGARAAIAAAAASLQAAADAAAAGPETVGAELRGGVETVHAPPACDGPASSRFDVFKDPVFPRGTKRLAEFCDLARELEDMYSASLVLKETVAGDILRHQPRGGERGAHAVLTTCAASWITQPYLDDARLSLLDEVLRAELGVPGGGAAAFAS
jgi:hypothetical protein